MQSWLHPTPTTTGGADKPDWLSDVENGVTTSVSVDKSTTQSQSFKDVPAYNGEADDDDDDNKPTRNKCAQALTTFVSSSLLTIWIYSAVVQDSEKLVLMWKSYYAVHAAVISVFLATYLCCSAKNGAPGIIMKPLAAALTAMMIWSTVLIVITVLWFLDDKTEAPQGDSKLSPKTNEIMDIAGPALGFVSALYHLIGLKCCLSAPGTK